MVDRYAHFDDQYIARHLEFHHSKEPLAGKNDLEMCELTLGETVTHKEYAEILDHELEMLWTKRGRVLYIRPVTKALRK